METGREKMDSARRQKDIRECMLSTTSRPASRKDPRV